MPVPPQPRRTDVLPIVWKIKKHNFSYAETRSRRTVINHSRSRVLHGYSLFTTSWRCKNKWPGPFRLLDLPPEIRNRVYEYLTFNEESYYINLYHVRPDRILSCLPPLLAANRQLCDEVGGYYFTTGHILFTIHSYRFDELKAWLSIIGPKNRERLANNMKVLIRLFIHPMALNRDNRFFPWRAGVCFRGNLLSDLTYLVDLDSVFAEVTQRYPTVEDWRLESYITPNLPPQSQRYDYALPHETRLRTPTRHFERLLPFLNDLLEPLGGTRAQTVGRQTQLIRGGPIWLMKHGGEESSKVLLPSGLQLDVQRD